MLDTATHKQPAQPTTPCRNVEGALHVQATTAPAACKRRALDGVAVFGGAMKRDGVKRLRQRRETSVLQRGSRWRLYAFGALSDARTIADSSPQALGEGFFAKGVVVNWRRERSGHTWNGAKAEGSFIAFCALSDASAIARAGGLRFIMQGA